ncbi:MAG: NAD-dependent epimerase/dehydratase family protein [Planctomycetota bacterium]|nr:MAG: NAD-dependent epimerase/dehydratase family protein [Planctomycetota bacterium]
MKRWLITGGAGFIGSHLSEALLLRGDAVVVLDDCSTGRLENLPSHPRLDILHGSVCDELLVDEACDGCTGVIHLAAAVGVRRIIERQVRSIVTNVRGTEVVLHAAAGHGNLPVFLASTSEVYGKGAKVPFHEDDDSVLGTSARHRWSYACAKLLDEFLALAYGRERGLPVTIGRFFNVTGPRQSPAYGMVLPNFCRAALAGQDLQVHGDGQQSRCFLHVEDCVRAVLSLLDMPQAVGQVFNIGSEEEISIQDLAQRVIDLTDSRSQISFQSYDAAFPQGGFEDMQRRQPDTTRLRQVCGWQPRLQLDDIIRDCCSTVVADPPG